MAIISNAAAKVINAAEGIVVDGHDVAGGYFVIDSISNIPSYTNITGALCYCTGDSKFYQYTGSSWQIKEFGTTKDATTQSSGLMSAADKTKLDGIATEANKYELPAATSSTLGGVKVGSNITVSSGTISLSKSNVTDALGYTPPTTNTTYDVTTGDNKGQIKILSSSGTSWNVSVNGINSAAYEPASRFNYLPVVDLRSNNPTPYSADESYKSATTWHLKYNTTIGLSVDDTYSGVLNLIPWNDASGGDGHQLAFNSEGIYHRYGNTAWTAWSKLAKTSDIPTKTSQLNNDSGFTTFNGYTSTNKLSTDYISGLATVATSGSYTNLKDKPKYNSSTDTLEISTGGKIIIGDEYTIKYTSGALAINRGGGGNTITYNGKSLQIEILDWTA